MKGNIIIVLNFAVSLIVEAKEWVASDKDLWVGLYIFLGHFLFFTSAQKDRQWLPLTIPTNFDQECSFVSLTLVVRLCAIPTNG